MDIRKMYIDGEWRDSSSGATFEVKNPATGETVAVVAQSSPQDIADAVRAAKQAAPAWRKTPPKERAELMRKAGEIFASRLEEIALQESLSTGRLLRTCRGDVRGHKATMDYYAKLASSVTGTVFEGGSIVSREIYTPIGVVACISPWNAPLISFGSQVAPALAAGDTVVIKPSSLTPLGPLESVKAMEEAGFPKGVVNIVLGAGGEVGQLLAEDPNVDMVAFTGGTDTGMDIIKASANGIKRLNLELGGKSPILVFDDADIEIAIDHIMFSMFSTCGQRCTAGSRALVQDSIYERFCARLKERVEMIPVGDPLDPATRMGPMITEKQLARVLGYIEIGKQEGAELLCGGHRITEGACAKGNFIEPTVFINVENSMRIAQEEIFGPVLAVERFGTEEEAFAMANDTPYGLAAGIYTKDAGRILRFGKEVDAAVMYANAYMQDAGNDVPIQCIKHSGYGMTCGIPGLKYFMNQKAFSISMAPKKIGYFD